MKVLLDTCIVMDFLQKREPFADNAKAIMQAAACETFIGCITAKSATDIYYLTHRCTHSDQEARKKLNLLLSFLSILDSAASDIFHALSSDTSDFEDAVMIETAFRSKADYIVTRNQRDYKKSAVAVVNPSEFLRILNKTENRPLS